MHGGRMLGKPGKLRWIGKCWAVRESEVKVVGCKIERVCFVM